MAEESKMRVLTTVTAGIVASLLMAQPAFAQSGVLTEPSDLSLLALGVVGLVLGRRGARKRLG
jgi:hypothetical protein